jgi:hypothetical protein
MTIPVKKLQPLLLRQALRIGAPVLALTGPGPAAAQQPAAAPFSFTEYEGLLRSYTDAQGRVDYSALRASARDAALLDRLVQSLAVTGPEKTPALYPSRQHALAYYLSAYNLLVWKNVIDQQLGQQSRRVDDNGFEFFKKPAYQVDGKALSLDDLEKKLIRPRFGDGRIHFALNCASGGCPRLPREAFVPERVEAQLDREARTFISEKRNVDFDPAGKRVRLSMIFKWYREDFAKDDAGLLAYLNKYRPAGQQLPPDAKIEHVEYDWRLNDKTLPAR